MIIKLHSAQNPRLKTIRALHRNSGRKKAGKTLLEGVHLIEACINAQKTHMLECLLVPKTQGAEVGGLIARLEGKAPIYQIDDALYLELSTLNDLSILAVIETPILPLPACQAVDCLILDGIQDNGNLGTILRTAAAIGVCDVFATPHTGSLWSPKTLRAGMGAHFGLRLYERVNADVLMQMCQVPFFATSSHVEGCIYQQDLRMPLALVLGHEGQGVSDVFLQQARPLSLPQPQGQESLNVAIAASVCMYEMLRQRRYS